MAKTPQPPISDSATGQGLSIERYFTEPGQDPLSQVEWELRDARIGHGGKVSFEQTDVEFPKSWSQNATNIVAQKYFRGRPDSPERERSVKQMLKRVAGTIAGWGAKRGYFATDEDAQAFEDELTHILLHQMAAFNSPVWFNVGWHPEGSPKMQASACFILSVDDTMESILEWNTKEGMIFRGGSGSGINLSKIRGSMEHLSRGGTASGPVSFMRGADAWAGSIKSGGGTRRAAKMVILDVDHPDIREFIWCKAKEEDKAAALRDAGFDMSIDGEGFHSIQYQNANNSVRVTDEFMQAVEEDGDWNLIARISGEPVGEPIKARELLRRDRRGRLALRRSGRPVRHGHQRVAHQPELGPDQRIEPVLGVHARRQLGLQPGVAEPDEVPPRGRHLRRRVVREGGRHRLPRAGDRGLALELSDRGDRRQRARLPSARHGLREPRRLPDGRRPARTTPTRVVGSPPRSRALMTGRGYLRSAEVAAAIGPYDRYAENREAHNAVMRMHRDAAYAIDGQYCSDTALLEAARTTWDDAVALGEVHGYRNAQATVLAPTGTISFLMDCDTTGVEPDFSLVKFKELVGGGQMTIVNKTVPLALETLGYDDQQVEQIVAYVNEHSTIVGAPDLKDEHLPVFDVAVGERAISHMGHIKMMGAIQPFISGAISKTVNMPHEVTVADIADAYTQAWRLGVKALAIYRDGSKTAQALRTDAQQDAPAPVDVDAAIQKAVAEAIASAAPRRNRMPRERESITHKFAVGGHEGYITAGKYDDGSIGEIFLTDIGKEGSTMRGMMNAFATAISIALQYGVPLETLVRKFSYMRFEPEGMTTNPEIPFAKSMPDYIMRWLASRFLDADVQEELGILTPAVRARKAAAGRDDLALERHLGAGARHPPPRAQPRPGAGRSRRRGAVAPTSRPDRHSAGLPRPRLRPLRPRPRSGLPAVRRHDAAHRRLLHVLELRVQHRLRLMLRLTKMSWVGSLDVIGGSRTCH